jgi:hypothetical protein
MRTMLRSKITLLFMSMGLLLAIPAVALANDILFDNLTDNSGSINLGTIAPGASASGTLTTLALECNSQGNADHVANDPTTGKLAFQVTPTLDSSSAAGSVSELTSVTPDLSVPSTWPLDNQSCDADDTTQHGSVAVQVTVPAGAAAGQRIINVQLKTADANTVVFPVIYTVSGGSGGGDTCSTPAAPLFATTSADADGSNGWFKTVPAVSASSTTAGATIEYATEVNGGAKSAYSATAPVLGEGITKVYAKAVSGTCSGETTDTFKIDTRLPNLNISGAAEGTSYDVCATLNGNGPLRPTFAPSDPTPGSGVTWVDANTNGKVDAVEFNTNTSDSWTTPTNAYGLGSYTYNASADDNAGNVQKGSQSYSVVYGDAANGGAFGGFLPPINAAGTRSVFKLTSTVPVKFRLTCNGAPISNVPAYLTVKKVDPTADGSVNEAIATDAATTGNQFRYADGGYHFNLSTKSGYTNPNGENVAFTAGTWQLIVSLDDGTTRSVVIDLRK